MPYPPKVGQARSRTPAPANGASIVASVNITAATTSGVIAYSRNPERTPIIAEVTRVHIKTGSSAACTLDIGTASSKVSSDNLMDGISVNAAANTVYDSILDHGTNGKTRQYVAAGDFFTVSLASGDANGLVADVYFMYQLQEGGQISA